MREALLPFTHYPTAHIMLLATILATAFVALTAAAPCPELRELRILWQIPAGGTAQWQVYRGYPDKNMPNGALVYPG